MAAQLNHTIVWCHDKAATTDFLTRLLGLPPPRPFHHFLVVDLDNGVSLDFMEKEGAVALQHYAFLVAEETFPAVLSRIQAEGVAYWADPARTQTNQVNRHDGGHGVYFEDPAGHHLWEVITRPYGG